MVSTSKILTVSYGTFSCTLEGFDDSFDTMKAIAEYFRDLAADDRYFGAEPPTPDAEMLARIAEKEIARRVEAREDEGTIHLRANNPAIAAAPAPVVEEEAAAQPAPAPEATEEAAVEAADAPAVELEEEIVAEDAVSAVVETEAEAAEDTAADDAIAAMVETPAVDAPVEDEAPEVEEAEAAPASLEDELNDAIAASVETAMADAEPAADVTEEAAQDVEESVEAHIEEADVDPEAAEDDDDDDDDDSVAARLRRIRSVVARGSTAFEPAGFSEDEHAQEYQGDTVSDLDAELMADAPEAADMPERVTSKVLENDLMDAAHDDVLDQAADAEFEDEANDIESLTEDTLSQLLADAIPEDAQEELYEDEDAEPVLEGEIQEDEDPTESPLRARVIKMKRSDFEAAVADGALEETFDVLEEDAFDDEPAEAILSPEDEADLQFELDAVAAELEAEAPEEEIAEAEEPFADASDDADDLYEEEMDDVLFGDDDEITEPEIPADAPAKSVLLGKTDRPISRLLKETQTHLDTPEASRRRSAIQHLRAAVEANAAESDAGSKLRPSTDEGAYRSDIADAMRAGSDEDAVEDTIEAQISEDRAVTRPRSRRPIESRPAPLKLVAEQRVDTPRDPVRPRRVSNTRTTEEVELPSGADSFSQFAEDIGAGNLSELLEAAAAYMSDVEGRVQFSRPMLMGKLKEATREDFSREDSLKSFGQLLRSGKLQKLKGGRFTVTDETEFRANKRDAS